MDNFEYLAFEGLRDAGHGLKHYTTRIHDCSAVGFSEIAVMIEKLLNVVVLGHHLSSKHCFDIKGARLRYCRHLDQLQGTCNRDIFFN